MLRSALGVRQPGALVVDEPVEGVPPLGPGRHGLAMQHHHGGARDIDALGIVNQGGEREGAAGGADSGVEVGRMSMAQ